ncbi:MAG: VCBS repeat-containing protein [Rhodobacteraceae bacterium]|nr:VCBS repeat-containing protein [Paracoccaceae bacterium]MCZ8082534.1 VCBS repeat-containing protein [Paracoccaceae bacterium]
MRSIRKCGYLWAYIVVALSIVGTASAQDEAFPVAVRASFASPTDRYPHNIMGRLSAHTDLVVAVKPCRNCAETPEPIIVRLPENLVFEDFAPRLVDLDLDGRPEIVVVESHQNKGARLAVWEVAGGDGSTGLVRGAATDFIGRRFRWLAPIGAADFDGDGSLELAYVETPHLGKTLRIVERDGQRLRDIAAVQGVTNHAIGQETVQSRIESCAGVPVIFALDTNGRQIVSIRMIDGQIRLAVEGPASLQHHLDNVPLCIN